MWLKHAPIKNIVNSISQHCQEAIFLTNISNHVKRMERSKLQSNYVTIYVTSTSYAFSN